MKNEYSKIPKNVVNKKLYLKIKLKIRRNVNRQKRRWGAYDSGRLVREYKNSGGKYTVAKTVQTSSLNRWYKEKWVDACAWPKVKQCGRADMRKKIAYCRPMIRITKNTPKTVKELSKKQINSRCKRKKNKPRKIIR